MRQQPRLLVAESTDFTPAALELLQQAAEVTSADLDYEDLLERIPDTEILWIRLRHYIGSEVILRAKNLRMIASPTTGLNHVDLDLASSKGIEIVSLRGEVEFLKSIRATAEHTIGLMLSLLRNYREAYSNALTDQWQRDCYRGYEIHEKKIGLVGYGRIGRIVANYLAAFGAKVLVSDPALNSSQVNSSVTLMPLSQLLQEADIVSLHASWTPETDVLFQREQFMSMRRGSWFINTARGELVNEGALIEVLENEHLAGAALDVIAGEQEVGTRENPLIQYARRRTNLLLSPHLGGCTFESTAKTELFLANKVVGRIRQMTCQNC